MTRLLSLVLAAPLALAACADAPADPPAPTSVPAESAALPDDPATPEMVEGVQVVSIEAGLMGFQPRQIRLEAGVPARLIVTRTVEDDCSSELTIPSYNVATTALPLGEPVAISFTPTAAGQVEFICGMEMQRGTIAVVS